jgi:hypothetical protein
MLTSQELTTFLINSEVIGSCFFTGRPLTRRDTVLVGPFGMGRPEGGTMTIMAYDGAVELQDLNPLYIRRISWT